MTVAGDPENPYELVAYAAARGRCTIVSLLGLLIGKVKFFKVPDGEGGTKRRGRAQFVVPEMVARNLRGPKDQRDVLLLVHIPRVVYDEMLSPIVRP